MLNVYTHLSVLFCHELASALFPYSLKGCPRISCHSLASMYARCLAYCALSKYKGLTSILCTYHSVKKYNLPVTVFLR